MAVEAARALDHGTYTYAVPEDLELAPGHRVWVPFGRRGSYGYVTELHVREPEIEVKEIERADAQALLLPHQLELARMVAAHYWAPLIECVRAMVPPRVRRGRSSGAGPSLRQTRFSRLLTFTRPSGGPHAGPPLAADQERALDVIRHQRGTLLHGVPGSGKTEV